MAGGPIFIKKWRDGGGGFRGGGAGGGRAPGECLWGGEGLNIYFGAEMPTKYFRADKDTQTQRFHQESHA